jgi:hypothetical protein
MAEKIIQPYTNIPYIPFQNGDGTSRNGGQYFTNVKQLQVGYGSSVFRIDRDGMWAGAEKYADAPWKVDWNGNMVASSIVLSGYIPTGGAAGDVNSGSVTISGGKITANSIAADRMVTGSLIVGTNVGLGTAQDSAGVTTIIGNTVTTGYVNALNVTAQYVAASIAISSPTITGGTISIGSGNNIFKADSNGIYLGNATYASAPFRVSMAGAVTASSLTLTNASIGSGSSYTGNSIDAAYIGNLTAAKITSGTITIGGANQPSNIIIVESSSGSAGATTSLLRWESTGGTLRGKIWSDSSGYMGYNAIGGKHYFYTNGNENVVILDGAQTVFQEGISCRGSFNVGVPNSTTEDARFTNNVYFDATNSTAQYIWGGSGQIVIGSVSSGGSIALTTGTNGYVSLNWLKASGTSPQIGTSDGRFYFYGSTVRYTTLTNDSDRNVKKNISPTLYGLKEIEALSPVNFEYLENDKNKHIGFIAQDVEKIMPEIVSDDEGKKCMSTIEIIPVLVRAVQELSEEIKKLKNK